MGEEDGTTLVEKEGEKLFQLPEGELALESSVWLSFLEKFIEDHKERIRAINSK